MFEAEKLPCKCVSASTNNEKMGAGGDTRLGMSIYVEFLGSNEILDKFDPKLRPALYESAANDAQQDFTGHLPNPKFRLEKPIYWPLVCSGYDAAIHPEFDVNDAFDIEDVKVDKFQFSIKDEAVVGYKFRLYFHPNLDDVGKLCALQDHEIKLSLIAPQVSEIESDDDEESPQEELFGGDTDTQSKPKSALYPRAVASVKATKNPTASALQTEFKISLNEALQLLMEMEENGVIEKDGDEYVLTEDTAEQCH